MKAGGAADTMNSKQRMVSLVRGGLTDRVPAAPLIHNHAARVLGVKVSEYNRDGGLMGRAHVAAWEKYGHDLIWLFSTTFTVAEAMGTQMYFPEDDAPQVDVPVCQSPHDVHKVKVADPRRDGRLPVYLEAVRHCVEQVGNQVLVGCVFGAPLTTAVGLRGTEDLIRDTYRNPALVEELLRLAMESALRMLDAVVDAGGIPVLVEPVGSGSMISPAQFQQFVLPYLRPIVDRAHERGVPVVLHICGKTDMTVDLMAESGADILSVDKIDMVAAHRKVGDRCILLGNVKSPEIMLKGTPEQVDAEARALITNLAGRGRGFVLSSGCEIPLATPPENVLALIEAARKYSPAA